MSTQIYEYEVRWVLVRILILAGWYPNHNNPMKGIFIREQARALAAAGLSVAVFYPFDEEISSDQVEMSQEQGILVFRANTYGKGNRYLARLLSYDTAQKKLREVVERFRPELIHVHVGYPAGIIAYLFTRSHRIPYVITEHMSYLKDYVEKWQHRILLRPAFEQAARVLPVSASLAEQIKGFGWKVKLQTVPNVVDTDRFNCGNSSSSTDSDLASNSSRTLGSGPSALNNQINFLFVGNMEETQVKGLQFLLPALAKVLAEFPKEFPEGSPQNLLSKKIHLHCVGDGPKRQDYEKLAEDLGITNSCTFYGRMNPERMPEFYQLADVLVLSSLKETFGCVLIEAMSCGKPVVATACGGPQDIVKPEVGVLVEPGSTAELVRGINQVISSLEGYCPEVIRSYAEENFSPKAIAKTLSKIYEEVLVSKST